MKNRNSGLKLQDSSFEDYRFLPTEFGKYGTPIGKGAFGKVYRATYEPTMEDVAIKVYNKAALEAMGMTDRAFREAMINCLLPKHENIVEVYRLLDGETDYFFVMELCEQDLSHYIYNCKSKPCKDAIAKRIFGEIVDGLIHLESVGVTHRDIKPANILLTKDLHVKIADFGLAIVNKAEFDVRGSICGTAQFMSREMHLSGNTAKADIWSLGILLYFMLTGGSFPFQMKRFDKYKDIRDQVFEGNDDFSAVRCPYARDLLTRMLHRDRELCPSLLEIKAHRWLKNERSHHTNDTLNVSADSGHCSLQTSASSGSSSRSPSNQLTSSPALAIFGERSVSGEVFRHSSSNTSKQSVSFGPSKPLDISNLKPQRLPLGRQAAEKSYIGHILDNGDVVIELQKGKQFQKRVTGVIRLRARGSDIEACIFHPGPESLPEASEIPPAIPEGIRTCSLSDFANENRRTYKAIATFIDIVKSKTAIFKMRCEWQNLKAKCYLMRNGNVETNFLEKDVVIIDSVKTNHGGITESVVTVKTSESVASFAIGSLPQELHPRHKDKWECHLECKKRILKWAEDIDSCRDEGFNILSVSYGSKRDYSEREKNLVTGSAISKSISGTKFGAFKESSSSRHMLPEYTPATQLPERRTPSRSSSSTERSTSRDLDREMENGMKVSCNEKGVTFTSRAGAHTYAVHQIPAHLEHYFRNYVISRGR